MILSGLAFFLGIVLLQQLPQLPSPHWFWIVLPLLPALVSVALLYPRVRWACCLLAGLLWAMMHAHYRLADPLPSVAQGRDLIALGHIAGVPEEEGGRARFLYDVDELWDGDNPVRTPGRVRLSWYGDHPDLVPGRAWQLRVRLKRPHGFMNPGGFDYEAWLFERGIRAIGYVRPGDFNQALESISHAYGLARARHAIFQKLSALGGELNHWGILAALTVGVRGAIHPETWQTLLATGTNHLVAISGLHIGLAALLGQGLARFLWGLWPRLQRRFPRPQAAAFAALVTASAYAAMAGFSLPTRRALIMLFVLLGSVLLRRNQRPGRGLMLALTVVLIFDPMAPLSAGFWLSFAAVAVIFYVFAGRAGRPRLTFDWVKLQWAIGLALVPLTLVLFQRGALIAPVANLIAVPLVSLAVVPFTLAGGLLVSVSPTLTLWILGLPDFFLGLLLPILSWLADLPLAQWRQHQPPTWALLTGSLGVLLILLPRATPARWLGTVFFLPLFLVLPSRPDHGEYRLHLLDVGQGLAAVVETRSHALVYDTGPRFSERFNAGEAIVLPFLRAKSIHQVDAIVISHGDQDHAGGASGLLAAIPVGRVLSSVPELLPQELVPQGAAQPCRTGDRWHWDGVDFEMLHPPFGSPLMENEASCVLRVSNKGGVALLPGDIERAGEAALLESFDNLAVDLLVAPHHGSTTSSSMAFVAATRPTYVLYSVGFGNRFGFPKIEVAQRYQRIGARALRTDTSGAISFSFHPYDGPSQPDEYRARARRYWHAGYDALQKYSTLALRREP